MSAATACARSINFTDVDDKTIAGARKAGVSLREYTDRFIGAFREDAEALGIEPAEESPRATDEANLRAMVETIQALEARGHAYRSDGSVYFRIGSSSAGLRQAGPARSAGMQDGARIDSDEYAKDAARDFVLWKAAGPDEPTWDYGVGPGRPGWHIECSAMALRLLDGSPDRHPRGGRRPDLSPPRERDRPVRGLDRGAVRALLGPRRAPAARQRA